MQPCPLQLSLVPALPLPSHGQGEGTSSYSSTPHPHPHPLCQPHLLPIFWAGMQDKSTLRVGGQGTLGTAPSYSPLVASLFTKIHTMEPWALEGAGTTEAKTAA